MEEKRPRRNQDTVRVLSVLGIGILITLIFIGVYYLAASNNNSSYSYVDAISGEVVNTQETGGNKAAGVDIVGLSSVQKELNIDLNVYTKMRNKLIDFFTLQYPSFQTIYYRKDTAKDDGKKYYFEVQSDKNERFKVELIIADDQYKLNVKDARGDVLNYDTSKTPVLDQDISILPSKLPYRFKVNDIDAHFSYDKTKKAYILSLNWCGDETTKETALKNVNEWAKKQGFNLDQIKIEVPLYCDGGAQ